LGQSKTDRTRILTASLSPAAPADWQTDRLAARHIRGITSQNDGWDGWLGRYQKAVAETAMTLERQRLERQRKRDLGR
jgi:hypothetical protein